MQAADDDEDVDTGPAALEFRVNVASVIECLTVFGAAGISNTSLHMSYENETAVFRLLLEVKTCSAAATIQKVLCSRTGVRALYRKMAY